MRMSESEECPDDLKSHSGEACVCLLGCAPVFFVYQNYLCGNTSTPNNGLSAHLFGIDFYEITSGPVHKALTPA